MDSIAPVLRPDGMVEPVTHHGAPPERGRVFRSGVARTAAFYAYFSTLLFLFPLYGEIVGERRAWVIALMAGLSIGTFLYGFVVLSKIGVEISENHVVLHGVLGSRRLDFSEIQRFEMGQYQTRVRLNDESTVNAYGLGASGVANRRSRSQIAPLVEELNRLVAASNRRQS